MTPTQRVLNALREQGLNPKSAGDGWQSCCPAHEDRTPSLSIKEGDEGCVLLHCHAGCEVEAICAALKITKADLFTPNDNSTAHRSGKTRATAKQPPQLFATAKAALETLERRKGKHSALWVYRNANGEPVGVIIRWDTSEGGKDIRPISRSDDGKSWLLGGMPLPRPLYRLPELLAAPLESRVYVVEGEKAADAAARLGLVVTTSPHGSKSAGKADWSHLAGRSLVILPDNDDAGGAYANEVATLAHQAGATSVRIVRLVELWSELPKGGDIADLAEHRKDDLDSLREEVEAMQARVDNEPPAPRDGSPFVPFPTDTLPEPIRGFVTNAAIAIGCDESYVALPLLTALASAIGTTHQIELKRGWTEPAILWTVIVGESGVQKSPAFKLALNPIREAQQRAFKAHETAMDTWKSDCMRYKAEFEAWRDDAKKKRTEHGFAIEPPREPAPPILWRCLVSDTTVEAIAPILRDNPRGVLLARDELNGWFSSFGLYKPGGKGADSSHWLSMHGGDVMTVDRKSGTPPTINVPSASVNVVGGIQPGILRLAMTAEHHESGLLARILFAMPPRRKKQWTESEVDQERVVAVAGIFTALFDLKPNITNEGDECSRIMRLCDGAKRAWIMFFNEHNDEQMNLTGDDAAAWAKLEGYAARFALIIHLIRVASNEIGLDADSRVDESSVEAGIKLARWFGNESKRVYAILSESKDDCETRRLVEWIERKGGMVTARDLTHSRRAYRGNPDAAAAALSVLVEAGIGSWEHDTNGPTGGRPTQRFRLLPPVTVTETQRILDDSIGIGDGDTTRAVKNDGWGEL